MRNLLALVLAAISTCVAADLKVKLAVEKPTLPALAECPGTLCVSVPDTPGIHEETIYVHGSSQRVEFQGVVRGEGGAFSDDPFPVKLTGNFRLIMPHMAVITHCDTGQVIELDLDSHEYREFKQPKYPSEKKFAKDVERLRKDAEKRVHWKTVDTGERKQFFGLSAKHEITTIKEKKFIIEFEEVVDGWYIDLAEPGCAPEYLRQGEVEMFTFDGTSNTDVFTSCNCVRIGGDWSGYRAYSTMFWAEGNFIPIGFREVTLEDLTYSTVTTLEGTSEIPNSFYTTWLYVGFTPPGLPVEQTISGKSWAPGYAHEAPRQGKGNPMKTSIVELSTAPVDPSLFEIPPGFVKVKQLYQHRSVLQRVSK